MSSKIQSVPFAARIKVTDFRYINGPEYIVLLTSNKKLKLRIRKKLTFMRRAKLIIW